MRYTNLLPFAAALATAIVIPDDVTAQQLSLEVEKSAEKVILEQTEQQALDWFRRWI